MPCLWYWLPCSALSCSSHKTLSYSLMAYQLKYLKHLQTNGSNCILDAGRPRGKLTAATVTFTCPGGGCCFSKNPVKNWLVNKKMHFHKESILRLISCTGILLWVIKSSWPVPQPPGPWWKGFTGWRALSICHPHQRPPSPEGKGVVLWVVLPEVSAFKTGCECEIKYRCRKKDQETFSGLIFVLVLFPISCEILACVAMVFLHDPSRHLWAAAQWVSWIVSCVVFSVFFAL